MLCRSVGSSDDTFDDDGEIAMSEKLEIRQADASDEAAIRACAEDAYAQYIVAIRRKPAPMGADFKALIASGFVYVASDAQAEILGFIVFFSEGDRVLLENVAVKTTATGRGIGKLLIAFCESEARRYGAKSIKLYTNEKMTGNLSIYPHLGYQETGRRVEDGFKRIFFEKDII